MAVSRNESMTPDRWQRVNELFEEALLVPLSEHADWLQQAADGDLEIHREVSSLLSSYHAAQGGFLEKHVQHAVVSLYEAKTKPIQPLRAGPYSLVRELGRGGMGTVYLGERDDQQYQSKVAVKLVRGGMDTDFILNRFRRERQTLARLHHPNIARLLDGGTTDSGLPYIVMEYVDGNWITQYCDQNAVGLHDRLRLFLQVCSAVEYAHQNFVIHRDLKPGNILVENLTGTPKLLDFGVCKLLYSDPVATDETSAGLLTPDYASPEQIRGEQITIASDVYSLGAILYELLCGIKPHRISKHTPQDIERAICDIPVVRPSTAALDKNQGRRLSGDLDNIVLRALEKEARFRYSSATQLAEDIERYLVNSPIRARPQTLMYRAAKFSRRHRGALTGAIAIFFVLLASAFLFYRQARIAQSRLEQVRSLSNQFIFEAHDAIRDLPGATRARQLILSIGLQNLDTLAKNAKGDWKFELELAHAYGRMADVQGTFSGSNLGNTQAALASCQQALALLASAEKKHSLSPEAHLERIALYRRVGDIEYRRNGAKQALPLLNEALRDGLPLLQQDHGIALRLELGDVYVSRSQNFRNEGNPQQAFLDGQKALQLFQEAGRNVAQNQPDSRDSRKIDASLASSFATIGMAEAQLGKLQEALKHYRQNAVLLEDLAARFPENSSYRRELMLAYGHLGDVLGNNNLQNLGDPGAALVEYRRAAAIGKQIFDSDPADQRAASDYGIALSRASTVMTDSDPTAKLAMQQASLTILNEVHRIDPQNAAIRIYLALLNQQIGDVFRIQGNWVSAVRAWQEALQQAQANSKLGQPNGMMLLVSSSKSLAEAAVRAHHREEALKFANSIAKMGEAAQGKPSLRFVLPRAHAAVGTVYRDLAASPQRAPGDRKQATTFLRKSLGEWKQLEQDPAFSIPHRRDLADVQLTLSSLEPVSKKRP